MLLVEPRLMAEKGMTKMLSALRWSSSMDTVSGCGECGVKYLLGILDQAQRPDKVQSAQSISRPRIKSLKAIMLTSWQGSIVGAASGHDCSGSTRWG